MHSTFRSARATGKQAKLLSAIVAARARIAVDMMDNAKGVAHHAHSDNN